MDNSSIEKLGKCLILFSIFLFGVIIFIGVFYLFTPHIHETGHFLQGMADGLIKGKINSFQISNWVDHPMLAFIKTPQQIKPLNNSGSLNFALGGPIFSILIFLGLSFVGHLRSKDWKWFLIFLSILIFEISGNVICGTDNFTGGVLSICNAKLDIFLKRFSIFLFSGTFSYFVVKVVNQKIFRKNQ